MITWLRGGFFYLLLILFLSSCGTRTGLAPVVESHWREVNSHAQTHKVRKGETLYAIAFRYDQDYRRLAVTNSLRKPYQLYVGQTLNLRSSSPRKWVSTKPIVAASRYPKKIYPKSNAYHSASSYWHWPSTGRVVTMFAPEIGKKGIDIAGKKGNKIQSAAAGVVAYAGSGLTGYGNLIIIKHDKQFLTAYGNNAKNLVREGQKISKGQVIAEMGVVNRNFWGVHFEIRKAGTPVNPLQYLPRITV